MVAVVGVLLIAETAVWQQHQRQRSFAELPPGERQLAIFDAYASHISQRYYDRKFIDGQWPALRAEWRAKAAGARNDVYLYDQIFVQVSQLVPSSHVGAIAPRSLLASASTSRTSAPAARQPGDAGFEIAMVRRGRGGFGSVADVARGSPADLAGIEPGWQIVSFQGCLDSDKRSATFIAWGTPAQRLELEAGKQVDITALGVKTEAEFMARYQRKVDYTCKPLRVRQPFESRVVGRGVRYIRFDGFTDAKVIDQVLDVLDGATAAGVILDFRNNTGGHVEQELRLIDRLLPENAQAGTFISSDGEEPHRARPGRKYAGPLAVLVGPLTASAGEVVAAALQDNHLATLLGRSTSGATLMSDSFPLPDGGIVHVAYKDYVRASGQRIEGVGVIPDIGIMPTLDDVRAGRDAALERALEELAAHSAAVR
jgi:carboxyl-terminal processing protease